MNGDQRRRCARDRQQRNDHDDRRAADEEGRGVRYRRDCGVLMYPQGAERPGGAGDQRAPVAGIAGQGNAALAAEHHPQPAEPQRQRGEPGAGEAFREQQAAEHRGPDRAQVEEQDRGHDLGEDDRDRIEDEGAAGEQAGHDHARGERGARGRMPEQDREEERQPGDEEAERGPYRVHAAGVEVAQRDPVQPPQRAGRRDRDLGAGEPRAHHVVHRVDETPGLATGLRGRSGSEPSNHGSVIRSSGTTGGVRTAGA